MPKADLRLNVRFTDRQRQSIEGMAAELDCSMTEVIRRAMALMRTAIAEEKAGNQICVTKDGKIVKQIVGILR